MLLPYLQRADELQKHEPLVAYYCRVHAMERGLQIPAKERTKTTNAILISLINQLEKDKKSLQLSPDDNMYVEGFALNVFAKADKQDRADRADMNTAKTFYAASIFIEILYQFGEVQPDMEQKQKYAVWKAANIRKALSEGRKPVPGPPVGDEELSISSGGVSNSESSQEKETIKESEQKPVEQASSTGFGISSLTTDEQGDLTSQFSQPAYKYHDLSNMECPSTSQGLADPSVSSLTSPPTMSYYPSSSMPDALNSQQLPDPLISGLVSPLAMSYYPSSTTPDASPASVLIRSHQYGTIPQLDGFNGQSHYSRYNQYASSFPDVPQNLNMQTEYSTHHGVSDASYYHSAAPIAPVYPVSTFPSTYASLPSGNIAAANPSGLERTNSAPASVKWYQPPPEKIAEAQKSSKFAVSALAFDDVPTAISYLKQSIELLTNPSVSQQQS